MEGRKRQHGFTLLEMLIAMALMIILAGSLYASVSIAFQGRRAAERVLEPARRCSAAMRMLESDLESAVGASGLLAGPFLSEDLEVDGEPADVLTFHALARDQLFGDPPSAIVLLEITTAQDEDTGETLLVRRTTTNLLAPETAESAQETLCRGVKSFDTAYFDGTSWLESWDSTVQGDVLPLAVQVTLVLQPDEAAGEEHEYTLSRVFALPGGSLPQEGQGEGAPGGSALGGGNTGGAGGGRGGGAG